MSSDEQYDVLDSEFVFERFRCVVDKGQTPLRVDKYLTEHMAGTSRNRIQLAAEAGNVWANGKPVSSNYKAKPGDVLQVLLDHEPRDYTILPEDIPLDIVYEDDDLMVVNKQAGLVVHPGHGNWTGTLLNALAWYFRDNPKFDANNPDIGLVHRIDKDTSGLLLIAKTPEAKAHLANQFFLHTTQRTYNALVWGTFTEQSGTIEGALGRDNRDRTIYRVWNTEDNPLAKEAVTHWHVLEQFPYVTLVECRLETGRTHQIRVHLAENKFPIVCDPLYSGNQKPIRLSEIKRSWRGNELEENPLLSRLALHAYKITFTHPKTGQQMTFTAPYPKDMDATRKQFAKIFGCDPVKE